MKRIILCYALILLLSGCCNNKSCSCAKTTESCENATSSKVKKDIRSITFDNDYFYTDGKFNEDKAKDAVIALMEYHNYPIFDGIREMLWVSDYGTGEFAKLGLAAICPINNQQDLYMLQDLYLLPGQMLPEHWHEKPANLPIKMEAWFVRHGESYVVGVGEDNMVSYPEVKVPKCHMDGTVTTKHITLVKAGQLAKLKEAKTRHWQFAGKEGAIMSEVANVHSNEEVRHSDKGVNDHFLGE